MFMTEGENVQCDGAPTLQHWLTRLPVRGGAEHEAGGEATGPKVATPKSRLVRNGHRQRRDATIAAKTRSYRKAARIRR
jgi:hypothetical protein